MKIKLILINFFFLITFYIIGDLLFSKFIFKRAVDHKCYEHINYGKFYKLRSNCYAKMRMISSIEPYEVYTNTKGLRYSGKSKILREKNIVFLGDSQTFGVGNSWENTFAGIIENNTEKYNVYNLGVPSYSPTVYNYIFNEYMKSSRQEVDKVYVFIDLTDIADESNRWNSVQGVPELNEKKIIDKSDALTKFKRENFKGIHLISTNLRFFLRALKKNKEDEVINRYKPVNGNPTSSFIYEKHYDLEGCKNALMKNEHWFCGGVKLGLDKTRDMILNLSLNVKSYNSEFYIIIMPWPDTLNFGQKTFNWEKFGRSLCEITSCDGLINLFDEFQIIKSNDPRWLDKIYLKDDIHLTSFANNIVANKIMKESF